MYETGRRSAAEGVSLVAAGLDALLELDLDALDEGGVVALLAQVETQGRRIAAASQRLVTAVEDRRIARARGHRDTAALLRRELRLSVGEARARVRAAQTDLPEAAAGQQRGELSPAHARVVRDAVDRIPAPLRSELIAPVEARLVADARSLDPGRLAARAAQLLRQLDPEGLARREAEHHRLRSASLVLNADGSGDLRAHLTPEGVTVVQAALLPLTAPRPRDAAGRDERTAAMRLHDGLVEACRRLLSTEAIPGEGGVPATVIVTVPLAELTAGLAGREGLARTQYGGTLTVHELLRVAGEALVVPVVVDARGAPLDVGRARRFATKEQTYALIARDRGCSFPGCDHPPPWTQRHHILAWILGGPTDLDNLTLLCGYHHANFAALGWECVMIDRIVHWVPPASVDPLRRPVRNTSHDTQPTGTIQRAAA